MLIFDQQCAAEKRRERKRGIQPTPEKFVFINERVCEGCGDCGDVSSCMSVEPIETEFGRKTQIHQSSCNQDYSCLKGDCPSFITVYSKQGLKKPEPAGPDAIDIPALPDPELAPLLGGRFRAHLVGIGGTGVVTANQILAYAAMIDGYEVESLDQSGMAQKGGAVISSTVISDPTAPDASNKVGLGQADVLFAFDTVGTASPLNLDRMSSGRTVVIGDTALRPTSDTVRHVDRALPSLTFLETALDGYSRAEDNVWIEAETVVERLLRDHMLTNSFLIGVAYQAGRLPLTGESIETAYRMNGVQVEANLQAFRLGRLAHHDPAAVTTKVQPPQSSFELERESYSRRLNGDGKAYDALLARTDGLPDDVRRTLAIRIGELVLYQDTAYAERYLDDVLRVAAAEQRVSPGRYDLTVAAAKSLHKLMAYKDEYEVARLLLDGATDQRIKDAFVDAKPKFNLHPPMLRERGLKKKLELGSWFRPSLGMLVRMKGLRGSKLDPFGRAEVRRVERELIDWYRGVLADIERSLTPETYDVALAIAGAPEGIRGYESIKLANVEKVRAEVEAKRAELAGAGEATPAS